MKVILSIDPVKFPLTGIGRYTLELAQQLLQLDEAEELKLFAGHNFATKLPSLESTAPASFTLRHQLLKNRLSVSLFRLISPALKAAALKKFAGHVFHGPNFYLPPFDGPSVVTFHDLSMYLWQQCHPAERLRYMHKEIPLTLARADMLITDSEYIRREIVEYFGWPDAKIRVAPLASSGNFFPQDANQTRNTLTRYGLHADKYSLYAGTIEPRKNIDTLLDAYSSLSPSLRNRIPLVLCGYRGWGSEKIHARIESGVREGWVKFLGYVPDHELPKLFAGARLFVFPSLYEGFGLPVLEAMSSGTPVISSNAASLPEVTGDAAALFNPLDAEVLRALLTQGLEDENWRRASQHKGLLRAAEFSWKKCAEKTLSVYKELATPAL